MASNNISSMKIIDFAKTSMLEQLATKSKVDEVDRNLIKIANQLQSQKRMTWKRGGKSRI